MPPALHGPGSPHGRHGGLPGAGHVVLLLTCACGGAAPAPCNEVFDSAARSVDPSYVPYRWCDDIGSEADRIHGSYTCTSEEVDLGGEVVTLAVEPHLAIEDSLLVIGVVTDECVEVVTWSVELSFTSAALSGTVVADTRVYKLGDGDRTLLADEAYRPDDFEGWLLGAAESPQDFDIYSATPIGDPHKRWAVSLGSFDDAVELSCE